MSVGRIRGVYGTGATHETPPAILTWDHAPMDDEDREFYRWYGPWDSLTPHEVARLLTGLAAPWWIVGGWAIEAFTGRSRAHEDIDVAFFKADLPVVLEPSCGQACASGRTSAGRSDPSSVRRISSRAAGSCGSAAMAAARG